MTVGVPTGYQESADFVPSPLDHGSMPTDGLKGFADNNVRFVSPMWSNLSLGGSAGTSADVAAAGAIAALTLGSDVALQGENTGSPVAGKAHTQTVSETANDDQFGVIAANVSAAALDQNAFNAIAEQDAVDAMDAAVGVPEVNPEDVGDDQGDDTPPPSG